MNMRRFILVMLFALVVVAAHGQNDAAVFTPNNGFSGLSEGNGELRLFFSRKPFHVENHGFDRPVGSFQLDQAVQFEGNAPEIRTWVMRPSKKRSALHGDPQRRG